MPPLTTPGGHHFLAVGPLDPEFCPSGRFRPVLPPVGTTAAPAVEERVARGRGRASDGTAAGHVAAAGLPPSILGLGLPSDSMAGGANEWRGTTARGPRARGLHSAEEAKVVAGSTGVEAGATARATVRAAARTTDAGRARATAGGRARATGRSALLQGVRCCSRWENNHDLRSWVRGRGHLVAGEYGHQDPTHSVGGLYEIQGVL
jgi:hypothetical protein